ncbi:MAG: GTP 3',8-cyclase MoaA [Bacteroidales bacterium]
MLDQYSRNINYLRISITDRCNLRCTYCMPAEGIQQIEHSDILSFEEIIDFVNIAVKFGFNKIRITGGEPLVRKGVVNLVDSLAKIPEILDLSMTTNGILLKQFAHQLKNAGLKRINVSLDTIDPDKFRQITRIGNISDVLEGLQLAKEIGLNPIKLNCVVDKSSSEPDAIGVKEFAEKHGFIVRFIPKMDLDNGTFGIVEGGEGGNCSACNRLRLTADGIVKPCLFNNLGYKVRELGAEEALKLALANKPKCGTTNQNGEFYNIGG